MTNRTQVEKSLSALHALLGESAEAAAAVDIVRDLITAEDGEGFQSSESSQCYCVDRLALAVELAIKATAARENAAWVALTDRERRQREERGEMG